MYHLYLHTMSAGVHIHHCSLLSFGFLVYQNPTNRFLSFLSQNMNEACLTTAQACKEFNVVPTSQFVDLMVDMSLPIFGVTILSPEIYKR